MTMRITNTPKLLAGCSLLLVASSGYCDSDDLLDLSVEDLLNVEVTSVSKKAHSLNDSAAAVSVITQEDIRRIGARSVPEALRLVPGVDVAKIDASRWAVSIRGFNNRMSNKLLVLVDGRNVYTRAFSGVYWEQQNLMLEDIERIEVIRGSGATLWGANAVNGVINIITRHSSKTQGGLLVGGGGTEEKGFGAFRYGGQLNDNTTARAYIKGDVRDQNHLTSGGKGNDGWEGVRTGFRLDSEQSVYDSVTIQGDAFYNWEDKQTVLPSVNPPYQLEFDERIDSFGGNALFRYKHIFSPTSDYSLQVYYDFYQVNDVQRLENRHAIDVDFQHRFSLLEWNDVVWGARYRYSHDNFEFRPGFASMTPQSRNDQLVSAFVQDEITIVENHLWLTLGSKFQHNDYSGFEVQPSARLMWAPHPQHRLWAAISRAVRTPSRAVSNLRMLTYVAPTTPAVAVYINGNPGFKPEQLISYELGYRTTMIDNVSLDMTVFYNDYKNLRSADPGQAFFNGSYVEQPLIFGNQHSAKTYGLEVAAVWQMLYWWRWDVNYSLLKMDFNSRDAMEEHGQSPQQRVFVRSVISPTESIDMDIMYRYVDKNIAVGVINPVTVSNYMTLDVRLAWRPESQLELSLTGQNLLAAQHREYVNAAFEPAINIDRGIYGKFSWNF